MNGIYKSSAYSFLVRSSGHALRFFVGLLLARILGAKGYGVYSYAITVISVISLPAILGLDHTLLRFIPKFLNENDKGRLRGILRFAHVSSTTSSLLIALVTIFATTFFAQSDHYVFALMFLTLPLIIAGQVRQAIIRSMHHPIWAQIPENIVYPGGILLLLLGWVTWHQSVNVEEAAYINLIAWIVTLIVGYVALYKVEKPLHLNEAKPTFEIKQWFAPAIGLVGSGLGFILLSKGEVLVLGKLRPSHDVGIYVAAARGAEMIQFVYEAMTIVGVATFSRLHSEGNKVAIQKFVSQVASAIFWFTTPAYLAILIFAEPLLSLFGSEYVEASGVLRILTTSFFLSSLSGFIIVIMYVVGKQNSVAKWMWCFAGLNLALSAALIPNLGIYGAAISQGISLVGLKAVLVWVYKREFGILSVPNLSPLQAIAFVKTRLKKSNR
ncbi:MAG: hypothetical protein COT74_11170 [Bdellovibrionales bacterium CG10_big_fil_rev_8_21_14_0_10_45_34]|nr:MAG: hypothetical protein COT74_11170 [Bdellovibrionales bacterium CG10_big_fil_rev_8_21_14_0_10_45_34]